MTVDKKDLVCRIYQFLYEACRGYEDSMAYETAETVLNIYADLGSDTAITGWVEEIVGELKYCTDGEPSSKFNECLCTETDLASHVDEGFEILKEMFSMIIERKIV